MKTLSLLTLVLLLSSATRIQAQNSTRFKAELSFGIGLVPTFVKDRPQSITPPLNALAVWRVMGLFSVGLIGGYSASQASRTHSVTKVQTLFENQYSFGGLRLAVHTDPYRFDRWDIYGGMSGMHIQTRIKKTSTATATARATDVSEPSSTTTSRFTITGFVGARFAVNRTWGIWSELGFGAALLNGGISYRFVKKCAKKCRRCKTSKKAFRSRAGNFPAA